MLGEPRKVEIFVIVEHAVGSVQAVAAVKQSPESAAKAVAKTAPLFGWVLNELPGRRHVKLLADSAHARGRYPHIERRVRSLWDGRQ